jgi:hypothetical protein
MQLEVQESEIFCFSFFFFSIFTLCFLCFQVGSIAICFFHSCGCVFSSGCNGAALPKCIFGLSWGTEFSERMQLCSCRINYTSSNCNICEPIFLRSSSESVSTIQSSSSRIAGQRYVHGSLSYCKPPFLRKT